MKSSSTLKCAVSNVKLEPLYIGGYDTPSDLLEWEGKTHGICGECAIAAVLDKTISQVFKAREKNITDFRHYTTQKEMRIILEKLGYTTIQHGIPYDKGALIIPDCDLAILRVSFGDREKMHWSEIAKRSHYLGLRRFPNTGLYVFDNFQNFDGKPTNGIWVFYSEYYKVMRNEKMFITSYLELKKKGGAIPPNAKALGILAPIL